MNSICWRAAGVLALPFSVTFPSFDSTAIWESWVTGSLATIDWISFAIAASLGLLLQAVKAPANTSKQTTVVNLRMSLSSILASF
jgi:hypothetical protein